MTEQRLRALLDAAPDAIVVVNDTGKIVLVNVQTEKLFGYDRVELLDQALELLVPEQLRADHLQHRTDYFESPHVRTMGVGLELQGRRKDGSEFPIEVSLSPLVTEDGTLVLSAIRDVTVRREMEVRLRESEERFRLLVDAVKDYAIFRVDPSGRVASWNAGAERIKGYTSDEVLGQHISLFYPADDIRDGKPQHELEIATRVGRYEDEGWRVRKDGSRFLASITISAMLDAKGKLIGFAKVTRDITARHIADESLKLANRELEAFSYSVAHDLRAPLRGMNGFAQVLLNTYHDKLDAEGQDWLQEILANARKMAELIDGLLSLARVTRSELSRQLVDLTVVARMAAQELSRDEPGRGVEMVIEDGLSADIDPRLARTLFDNLLSNAWKFTAKAPSPRVDVGVVAGTDGPAFFVRDNGAGFDMAFADKLFMPFQRLHTVSEFPGTGIGLATVHRIIQRHGGRIWAEGRVRQGATFFFTLPRARS